jgi:hypothetical protein
MGAHERFSFFPIIPYASRTTSVLKYALWTSLMGFNCVPLEAFDKSLFFNEDALFG